MKLLLATLLLLSSCVIAPPAVPALHASAEEMFWRVAERLAQRMPVEGVVQVSIVDLPSGYLGLTYRQPMGLTLVMVDFHQDLEGLLDTLIHEWAHAATLRASVPYEHDELWGVAYSRAYRVKMEVVVEDRLKNETPPAEASGEVSGDLPGGGKAPYKLTSANSAEPVE